MTDVRKNDTHATEGKAAVKQQVPCGCNGNGGGCNTSVPDSEPRVKRGHGRPRKDRKKKVKKPKGKPGRPRCVRATNPEPIFLDFVLSFFKSRLPRFLMAVASIPDMRKALGQCTFPTLQLRICELLWMLTGGKSGLNYQDFLLDPSAATAIGDFCRKLGFQSYTDIEGKDIMPTVDTLKDDMESMNSECLHKVWDDLVIDLKNTEVFRGTRFNNMYVLAVDGLDGFHTVSDVPQLLHKKITVDGKFKRMEYYVKLSVASLCHISGGAGYAITAGMIKNKDESNGGTGGASGAADHPGSGDGGGTACNEAGGGKTENVGSNPKGETEKKPDVTDVTAAADATKQECESNALEGVVRHVIFLFGHSIIFLLDGLYLNGVSIRLFEELKVHYCITFKDDALGKFHETVEREYKGKGTHLISTYKHDNIVEKYEISFCNDIKYDFANKKTPLMNYVYLIMTVYKDGKEIFCRKFAWITNVRLNVKNIIFFVMVARRRWGVETMNNDLAHLATSITHKFDSHGNGPENFAVMTCIAELLQSALRDSNCIDKVSDTMAGNTGSCAGSKDFEISPSNVEIQIIRQPDCGKKSVEGLDEYVRKFLDRRRYVAAVVGRIRLKERWHTREGWCDYLCRSMMEGNITFEEVDIPDFAMLYNLTNQRK